MNVIFDDTDRFEYILASFFNIQMVFSSRLFSLLLVCDLYDMQSTYRTSISAVAALATLLLLFNWNSSFGFLCHREHTKKRAYASLLSLFLPKQRVNEDEREKGKASE